MTPYIVAASFINGPLTATAVIAADPTMAAAASMAQILRATQTQAELAGIIVTPLTAEFLAAALSALRGQPSGAVVSLVQPDERAATAIPDRVAAYPETLADQGTAVYRDALAAEEADLTGIIIQPPPVVA